ncbi:hypothetical protein SARC_11346 [Sphaeroforma arctica JP610]|uniref:Uncharacterized protein n=1 Tax=Sphaeroforma arctica JP610 TaxID=667725 RepID=A0A0L0FH92_9EUKA|nr:hypothetical protein SARC_11346 [Sphaeroforma arctica JP610]KNC76144.1 hypothetical protein SARC_11346 [Sphaeroforma arctica JP610]|eukprot:XP_014150046.1 hypothetical protein SARC_11346 [Sphaeroforma arctica JP610]
MLRTEFWDRLGSRSPPPILLSLGYELTPFFASTRSQRARTPLPEFDIEAEPLAKAQNDAVQLHNEVRRDESGLAKIVQRRRAVPYSVSHHPNTDAPIQNCRHSKQAAVSRVFTEPKTLQQLEDLQLRCMEKSVPPKAALESIWLWHDGYCHLLADLLRVLAQEKGGWNIPARVLKPILEFVVDKGIPIISKQFQDYCAERVTTIHCVTIEEHNGGNGRVEALNKTFSPGLRALW